MFALSLLSFSLYAVVAVVAFVLGVLFAAPVESDLAKAEADLRAELDRLHSGVDAVSRDVKKL